MMTLETTVVDCGSEAGQASRLLHTYHEVIRGLRSYEAGILRPFGHRHLLAGYGHVAVGTAYSSKAIYLVDGLTS